MPLSLRCRATTVIVQPVSMKSSTSNTARPETSGNLLSTAEDGPYALHTLRSRWALLAPPLADSPWCAASPRYGSRPTSASWLAKLATSSGRRFDPTLTTADGRSVHSPFHWDRTLTTAWNKPSSTGPSGVVSANSLRTAGPNPTPVSLVLSLIHI